MKHLVLFLLLAACTQTKLSQSSILGEWELVNYPTKTIQILDNSIIQSSENVLFSGHNIKYTKKNDVLSCTFETQLKTDSCTLTILNISDKYLTIEYNNAVFKDIVNLKRLD